jgi:LDH2 family malate/lactate/ureidoglycolate dehydrogenase
VRLPGTRRQAAEARARAEGIDISDALAAELRGLAGKA